MTINTCYGSENANIAMSQVVDDHLTNITELKDVLASVLAASQEFMRMQKE